jgi:hypothetical protein
MWPFKVELCLNIFTHTSHQIGLSPVSILMSYKLHIEMFDLLQCVPSYWNLKLLTCPNNLSQTLHLNGLSPVWILMWSFKWLLSKHFITNFKLQWFISSMYSRVASQIRNVSKQYMTYFTFVWFIASMNFHMVHQMLFKLELCPNIWSKPSYLKLSSNKIASPHISFSSKRLYPSYEW